MVVVVICGLFVVVLKNEEEKKKNQSLDVPNFKEYLFFHPHLERFGGGGGGVHHKQPHEG